MIQYIIVAISQITTPIISPPAMISRTDIIITLVLAGAVIG